MTASPPRRSGVTNVELVSRALVPIVTLTVGGRDVDIGADNFNGVYNGSLLEACFSVHRKARAFPWRQAVHKAAGLINPSRGSSTPSPSSSSPSPFSSPSSPSARPSRSSPRSPRPSRPSSSTPPAPTPPSRPPPSGPPAPQPSPRYVHLVLLSFDPAFATAVLFARLDGVAWSLSAFATLPFS